MKRNKQNDENQDGNNCDSNESVQEVTSQNENDKDSHERNAEVTMSEKKQTKRRKYKH